VLSVCSIVFFQQNYFANFSNERCGSPDGYGTGDENLKDENLNAGYYRNDFYAFDTQTKTWSQIANFPYSVGEAFAFSINGKGYVVCGQGNGNIYYRKDLYAYDPGVNTWTKMADFPGTMRSYPAGFVINNKAYVGGGEMGSILPPTYPTYFSDFYQYDPLTNVWTRKGDLSGPICMSLVSIR
jgi:N-acetylneuraminic acid mutarotase